MAENPFEDLFTSDSPVDYIKGGQYVGATPVPQQSAPSQDTGNPVGNFLTRFLDHIAENRMRSEGLMAKEASQKRIMEAQKMMEFNNQLTLHAMALDEARRNTMYQMKLKEDAQSKRADILMNLAAQESDPARKKWLSNAADLARVGTPMEAILKASPTKPDKLTSAEVAEKKMVASREAYSSFLTELDKAAANGEDFNDPKVKARLKKTLVGADAAFLKQADKDITEMVPKTASKAPDTIKSQMQQYRVLQNKMKADLTKVSVSSSMGEDEKKDAQEQIKAAYMDQLNTLAEGVNEWHTENGFKAPLDVYGTTEEMVPPGFWSGLFGGKPTKRTVIKENRPASAPAKEKPSMAETTKKSPEAPKEEIKVINGKKYVKRNGKVYPYKEK